MLSKMNLPLFLLFFKLCSILCSEDSMIADVVKSMASPTFIIATVCWTQDKKSSFVKKLNSVDTSVAFVDEGGFSIVNGEEQHTLFYMDTRCSKFKYSLKVAKIEKYISAPYRWLIEINETKEFSKQMENQANIPDILDFLELALVDSEILIAKRYNYRKHKSDSWIEESVAIWTKSVGLIIEESSRQPTALRRANLSGTVIPISYVLTNNDSINHLEDYKDDHIDTITKVSFPLTNQILDFLNADRRYLFVDSWGYLVDGNWTGMIGQMTRHEAEIGGSPMFFTADRLSVVEFIASPTPTRSKFVFRQPKLSYENNVFILPFRESVWYCCVAIMVVLAAGLLTTTAWEWKKLHKQDYGDPGILRANVSDVSVFVIGAACQQGSIVELKGGLGRVVMFILFLSFMFLYTSYSANIVALLQSSSGKIKTLNDLLHSRLKLAVDDNVFNHYYFSHATEPIRKAIYTTKIAPAGVKPRFMSMVEGVANMRQGLFAFHMETGVGYKFVGKLFREDEKCGLKEIQYLQVIDPFIAIKKDTAYREMFKIGIRRIQEFGLSSRENAIFYAEKPHCSGRGNSFISVSMVDCYPALMILLYGALCSVCLLVLEWLIYQRDKVKNLHICRK